MNRLAFLVLAALAASCSPPNYHEYQNSDLVLAPLHAARDACSCLFVMGQDEAFCKAWVRATPDVAGYTIDYEKKTVEAFTFMLWGAKARHEGERFGCVLE